MLEAFKERVSANGSMMAKGVTRLLQPKHLTIAQLLVREGTQNSWDARLANQRAQVRWEVKTLTNTAVKQLAQALPDCLESKGRKFEAILRGNPHMISLVDLNTIGLAGPTRADKVVEGKRSDFVSFVRNIGDHTETNTITGGTYGYGKSSFFKASEAGLIIVHTRTTNERGVPCSRLIVCQLADPKPGRYTGRAWWGKVKSDVVEPLTDRAADRTGSLLGIPLVPEGCTGTSITVVAPLIVDMIDNGPADARRLGEIIADAVLWNLWPKLVADGSDGLDLSVSVDGSPIEVGDPSYHPDLQHFVRAFQANRSATTTEALATVTSEIECKRPKKYLGRLTVVGPLPFERKTPPTEGLAAPQGNESRWHHIALLRAPELVVKYQQYPDCSTRGLSFAGVYIVDSDLEVDRAFAASEPSSHDDWIWESMSSDTPRYGKTYVKRALSRIREIVDELTQPKGLQVVAGGGGYATVSQYLGDLLSGGWGARPVPPLAPATKLTAGSQGSKVRLEGEVFLRQEGDHRIAVASVHVSGKVPQQISAQVAVLLADGSVEKNAPVNAEAAQFMRWQDVTGQQLSSTAELHWQPEMPSKIEVVIRIPSDAMASISLRTADI